MRKSLSLKPGWFVLVAVALALTGPSTTAEQPLAAPSGVQTDLLELGTDGLFAESPAMSSAKTIAGCANLDLNVFMSVAEHRPQSILTAGAAATAGCESTCTGYCGYGGCCYCFCEGDLLCTALCCKSAPEQT